MLRDFHGKAAISVTEFWFTGYWLPVWLVSTAAPRPIKIHESAATFLLERVLGAVASAAKGSERGTKGVAMNLMVLLPAKV
jgi:hypothetical protein